MAEWNENKCNFNRNDLRRSVLFQFAVRALDRCRIEFSSDFILYYVLSEWWSSFFRSRKISSVSPGKFNAFPSCSIFVKTLIRRRFAFPLSLLVLYLYAFQHFFFIFCILSLNEHNTAFFLIIRTKMSLNFASEWKPSRHFFTRIQNMWENIKTRKLYQEMTENFWRNENLFLKVIFLLDFEVVKQIDTNLNTPDLLPW